MLDGMHDVKKKSVSMLSVMRTIPLHEGSFGLVRRENEQRVTHQNSANASEWIKCPQRETPPSGLLRLLRLSNHGRRIAEEESWEENHGGIMGEESLRRNH